MAKKNGTFGVLAAIGAVAVAAAATAAVYYKREEIRGVLDDIADRFRVEGADEEELPEEEEISLVIDITAEKDPSEEEEESGEE